MQTAARQAFCSLLVLLISIWALHPFAAAMRDIPAKVEAFISKLPATLPAAQFNDSKRLPPQQGGEAFTSSLPPKPGLPENLLPFSPLLGDGREPSSFLRQRTTTCPFSPLLGDGREPSSFLQQRTATRPFSPLLGDGENPLPSSRREPLLVLFHHSLVMAENPQALTGVFTQDSRDDGQREKEEG
ncbi:hypothetical protein M5K25_009321 [Dendrobium thyrsiflorum]|uniref:Transmembrane protein n=1 Tax=Dendrobium thyrsiflorum TaxID=117978 RepID=A0ABD0VC32_DENTH